MPRGRPKKVKEIEAKTVAEFPAASVESFVVEVKPSPAVPVDPDQQRIQESRKALLHPLQPGQRFFESPDGEIIVGESTKDQVWSRRMNKGHGGWVNPRR